MQKMGKNGKMGFTFEELLNVSKNPTVMMQSELNKMPSGFLASPYG